jgi:DNA-binding transcriptional LysR family regulator
MEFNGRPMSGAALYPAFSDSAGRRARVIHPFMRELELSAINLNLLVALRALLIERHVGRAAQRVHSSQPAMSRSLAKLRGLFQDELLVRVGNRLSATPRAEALLGPLEDALARVLDVVSPTEFDPAGATGTLRIAAPDILVYMLIPPLLARLEREAPRLNLHIVRWSHLWYEHLESGEVDLTIGQPRGTEPGIYSRLLIRNTWASVLRRGHPALRGRWTSERFASLSHLLIDVSGRGGGQVDKAPARLGLERRIALRMPYVVLSPLLVAESDLVLTTARWLAGKLAESAGLEVRKVPLDLAPVDLPMTWHERTHRDARQRWFRGTLAEVADELTRTSTHPHRA